MNFKTIYRFFNLIWKTEIVLIFNETLLKLDYF